MTEGEIDGLGVGEKDGENGTMATDPGYALTANVPAHDEVPLQPSRSTYTWQGAVVENLTWEQLPQPADEGPLSLDATILSLELKS